MSPRRREFLFPIHLWLEMEKVFFIFSWFLFWWTVFLVRFIARSSRSINSHQNSNYTMSREEQKAQQFGCSQSRKARGNNFHFSLQQDKTSSGFHLLWITKWKMITNVNGEANETHVTRKKHKQLTMTKTKRYNSGSTKQQVKQQKKKCEKWSKWQGKPPFNIVGSSHIHGKEYQRQ